MTSGRIRGYAGMRKFFDFLSDSIVILSIAIALFTGLYDSIGLIFSRLPFSLPFSFDINQALTIALNSVVVVKIYETLKLFISHVPMSLTHIMELGLIGLGVKLFFDESYLSIEKALIFGIVFICYIGLKIYEYRMGRCDIHPGGHE